MAQKYKVFFFENVLLFTNNTDLKRKTTILYKYSTIDDLKTFLLGYVIKSTKQHVRIVCTDVEKTWRDFCSLFEIRKAAGGLVLNNKGNYLFIRRNGFWDIPKGHIEGNETSECCGLREVEEECGVSGMQIQQLICTTFHTYFFGEQLVLKATDWFLMKLDTACPTLTPQTEEGITEVTWIEPKHINTILENSYASISEVIKQLRKKGSL